MGRFKTLASNTLIFGICNFTSKLLVFFMLPFYTAVLSKEEFGTADLIVTIVGLLTPVLSISIAQGCMRFALDKTQKANQVFTFGVRVTIAGSLLLFISYPILVKISIIKSYVLIFQLLFISQVFQLFFSHFARGVNKVKLVGISGVVSSFVVVVLNIVLLFVFHFGVKGYLWSIIFSNFVAIAILFYGGGMYKYFTIENNSRLNKEIISYSLPLIPNSLSWWINHSANRLILNHFSGVADVGLYAAASKMPSIMDTFRNIFVQAWQLSTICEYDKQDSCSFFSYMYKGYNIFVIFLTSILIVFSQLLAGVLYSSVFFEAWIYTPFLLAGVMFGSLIAYYSPFYLAHKKTKILFYSTFAGAVITIVFNLFLIPLLGIKGAAITSLFSNLIIYLWLHIDINRINKNIGTNEKYYLSYSIIIIQAVLVSFCGVSPLSFFSLVCFVFLIVINNSDLLFFYRMITSAVVNNKKRQIER